MSEPDIWTYLAVAVVLYFVPTMIAVKRAHRSKNAIIIVNVLFGWTLVGWLWALLWANTGNVYPEAPSAARDVMRCPECAEEILREAKVCKHCGYRLHAAPST